MRAPRRVSLIAVVALALGVAFVVLLLLGGRTGTRPEPASVRHGYDCTASGTSVVPRLSHGSPTGAPAQQATAPAAGAVPRGFSAVRIAECSLDRSSDGTTTVRERVLVGDLHPLLDALAQPSEGPGWFGTACPATAELRPELYLVDAAGDAAHAAWPVDACGFSKPGVREALDALRVVTDVRHPLPVPMPD